MNKERMMGLPILALFLSATIILADQLIKYLVVYALKPVGTVTAIPGLLNLTYVENRGVAFGMMENQRWLVIIATVLVMAFLIFLLFRKVGKDKLFVASVVLIVGGGVGNLIVRVFLGYVIDYLQLTFFPPVCNFADYCVVVGTVLLMVYILFFSDTLNKKEGAGKRLTAGGDGNGNSKDSVSH